MSAKPLYGTRTAVTVTLASLANGAMADSAEYDNTTDLALSKLIEVNAVGSNAAESGSLVVYARESLVTAEGETDENLTRIGSVALNGSTAVRKVLRYDNVAPFFKLTFKVQSSSTYALNAAGNSANILSENIQDV